MQESPTGVYIYAAGVCRGQNALMHTFGTFVYTPTWVSTLPVLFGRLLRAKTVERAAEDTPFFVCGSKQITNDSDAWVSVGVTW